MIPGLVLRKRGECWGLHNNNTNFGVTVESPVVSLSSSLARGILRYILPIQVWMPWPALRQPRLMEFSNLSVDLVENISTEYSIREYYY